MYFVVSNDTEGTAVSCDYWSAYETNPETFRPDIEVTATYTDGHVEKYKVSESVSLKVSLAQDGSAPYPDGIGPGIFYLPPDSIK